ncbi:MAG: D-2-hydroxyacid dehydrogenase [Chloroflexi bacterium]|nr:D-2-hydroxyacid dehydrogenase [Chloroflexota bacterium]
MGFKLLVLPPDDSGSHFGDDWPGRLSKAVPGIDVTVCDSVGEAMEVIGEADAAFGNIVPELFERAHNLRWISCPWAGPPAGYYHQPLIDSDVVVTNMREIYSDHIGAHIMSFVLTFARGLHVYLPRQMRGEWRPGYETVHLPESRALVVGVGGIGAEAARLCSEFGITVVGVDSRREKAPPGVADLRRPDALDDLLPTADFVIVTVPETPATQGMFRAEQFRRMKSSGFFINIGRGATVVLDDLAAALNDREIAGAALDVFEQEPLPSGHPLWSAPGMIITPHVAATGPYTMERRFEVLLENCVRFNEGRPLINIVDKTNWF